VLDGCLASIAATMPGARVAIVEHSDAPGAFERLKSLVANRQPAARIMHNPANPGFGAGCNALARTSDARWLVILNPDAEVVSWPWRDAHPPESAIVGATFDAPGQAYDHAGRSYRFVDEVARSWLRRGSSPSGGEGFVSGAALLIDNHSFHRVGGFDEAYFLFYEDIDLCLRANQIGISTIVCTEWTVRHARGHSTRTQFERALIWSYESATRFHAVRGTNVWVYRTYVLIDAVARSLLHRVRRRRVEARAYRGLAQRAAGDLAHRRTVDISPSYM